MKPQHKSLLARFKSKSSRYIQDYLLNTSMHGLKYIGDVSLPYAERIFFLVAFSIVAVLSAYFISNLWYKWRENPIIIGLNAVLTPLSEIPFPAVTICNMNQARRSVADLIPNESAEHVLLESVCNLDNQLNGVSSDNYSIKWAEFKSFLINSSQPCREMLRYCRFASLEERCMDIFSSTLTDEGLCCTFNQLDSQFMFHNVSDSWDLGHTHPKYKPVDWTPEQGFPDGDSGRLTYPRRAVGAGSHMGLTIILDANKFNYYCSSTNSVGFKVLLHTPTETPKISNYGFFITPGQEIRAVVEPKINDASEFIRFVPVKNRRCFFASEGNLSFFRTYSKKNCEMECEAILIAQHCNCTMYYMPKVDESVKICNRNHARCYEMVRVAIEMESDATFSCSACLPACFEYSFGRELTTAALAEDWINIREKNLTELSHGYMKENIAVLHIFFMETSFRSYIKGEMIGFTEFLSSTGGLLGLFMGFSVLSIVEIIYFVSIRPYNKKYGKDNGKSDITGLSAINTGPLFPKRKEKKMQRESLRKKIAWIKDDDLSGLKVDKRFTPFPYME